MRRSASGGALLLLGCLCVLLFACYGRPTYVKAEESIALHKRQGLSGAAAPPHGSSTQMETPLNVDDDDESEFEEAPEDLPIPSAFARRPPPPAAPQGSFPRKAAAAESSNMALHALLGLWELVLAYRVIDCLALVLFALVTFTAIRGRATNTLIATEWLEGVKDLLALQFAAVAEATKGALVARSYSSFELFCSGRRNCMFMLATLECVPRQCLWRGHLLRRLVGPSEDLVTLEFVLREAGEGLIVNICRRQDQRSYIEAAWDIMEFCKVRHASSVASQLPEGFVLLADTQEAAEKFVETPGLQKHLTFLAPYLKCIYTSDLCTNTNPTLAATIATVSGSSAAAVNKPKRVFRMSYYLPHSSDALDPRLPLALACKLVDALASIRLSDSSRESVRKLRLAYEKEQQKHRRKEQQEALERRKSEKKKEQQKALQNLPEEQRRKAEEAQERKAVREQRKEQRQGIRVVRT